MGASPFTFPRGTLIPAEQFVPDVDEARRFLIALGGNDDHNCFQTFADRDRTPSLVRTLRGPLDQVAPDLVRLNQRGAGIFVAVNEIGPGRARRAEHVVRVRSLFIDADDERRLQDVRAEITRRAVPPSIVVESSAGRYHFYWLTNDCPLKLFKIAQQQLATLFETDRSVCDLPRVMRLPGFLHQKGAPFRSRLVRIS